MATRWFCTFCIMIPFFLVSCTANQNGTRSNKLIFLIVDGLPWQRINDDDVFPHMAQLRKEGTSVEYVKPVFPTVGYPNYFSLLTGLYPEEHGVVDEYMFDYRDTKALFVKGNSYGGNNTDVRWFRNGELFWTTAQNQGRRVAVYGWTSCNHSEGAVGPKPDHCVDEHREDTELKETYGFVDQALSQLEEGSVDIVLIFVNKLDYVGRTPGIHSKEFNDTLRSVDNLVGHIRERMDNSSLSTSINMIVLSTHGLASVIRPPLVIDISRFSQDVQTAVTFFPGGSRVAIYPDEGTLVRTFNNLYLRHPHINVYWKWNMPLKWRIRNGQFTAPIMVVADPGWAVAASKKEALYLVTTRGGLDGYDPDKSTDMRGVFVAMGPSFKQNYTHAPINITDLYNLICHLAEIQPSNNSGEWSHVANMLETDPQNRKHFTAVTKPPRTTSTVTSANTTDNATGTELPSDHDLFNMTSDSHLMPMSNMTREIIMILTNQTIPDEMMANGSSIEGGHGGDVPMEGSNQIAGNETVSPGHGPINETSATMTTMATTNATFLGHNGTANETIEEGSGFGEVSMMSGIHLNMTESPHLGSGEGSGEMGSGEEDTAPGNDSKRHRRSDDIRIIDSIEQDLTLDETNATSPSSKTWCECTGTTCTTRTGTPCETEPQKTEKVAAGSRIHQSTPGISVGTDEDKAIDDMRAEVEVHDWQATLANFTGRSREKRTAGSVKNMTDLLDEDEELGSGSSEERASASTSTQTSHDNRSDLSVRFVHKAQNGQQTSNTNTANIRSQRYELGGGFMVQNRYNRPSYNLQLIPDTDDLPSSTNRFIEILRSSLGKSAASGPQETSKSSEEEPVRVNQFNVAHGGQATQFIIQRPVVNFLMPPQETSPHTQAVQRLPPYKTDNTKPRIEILNFDEEDIF